MADSWQTLFDLGSCNVRVAQFGSEYIDLLNQEMAKGDSVTFLEGVLTVDVDLDGRVRLQYNGDISQVQGNSYMVAVVPNYAHDYPARVRGFGIGDLSFLDGQINDNDTEDDFIAYDLDVGAPDPMDMTSLIGQRDYVGMYATLTGGG